MVVKIRGHILVRGFKLRVMLVADIIMEHVRQQKHVFVVAKRVIIKVIVHS